MKATIWHNPKCGTSRRTLALLKSRADLALTVIRYLEQPPSRAKLAQLYRDAGLRPAEGLRLKGTDAAKRRLRDAGDSAMVAAMVAEPALIERPLVETGKGVLLCRPPERVNEIL